MADNTLTFGYRQGLPEGVRAAWGARVIVHQYDGCDFVPDRQDAIGEQAAKDELFRELHARIPMGQLKDTIDGFLRDGTINTREAREVGLYTDDTVLVLGNTNASAGYLYVCAFLRAHVPAAERSPEERAPEGYHAVQRDGGIVYERDAVT